MIKFLFLLLALVTSLPAGAANAPDYPSTIVNAWFNGTTTKKNPDPATACGMIPTPPNTTSFRYTNTVLNGATNHIQNWECMFTQPGYAAIKLSAAGSFSCPYGGTVNYQGGMCTGVPVGGGPPPENPCADKNPMIRRYNYGPTGPYTSPDNFGGCVVVPVEMMACHKSATGSFCYWKIVRTGDKYTGPANDTSGGGSQDATPPETTPPPVVPSPPIAPPPPTPDMCSTCRKCPAGTVQAGIGPDGVPMCVGTGTNPPPPPVPPPSTTKPPTTTTGADGSTVVKQDTVQTNKDGSTTTTTTTTTTAPDGTKSVTVAANTTAGTSGSPGKTDGNPQDDKYNLCKTNPTLSICRESSVSGTCGQITCTGDAIQCSTLRAAALMQCAQQKDIDDLTASPQNALGSSILSGADPMKGDIETMLKGEEIDLSNASLDESGFLGGGSCLPNRTITVLGKPVQVDFAQLCTNIQPLRAVIMACAFLAAYMLVSRSVLQS